MGKIFVVYWIQNNFLSFKWPSSHLLFFHNVVSFWRNYIGSRDQQCFFKNPSQCIISKCKWNFNVSAKDFAGTLQTNLFLTLLKWVTFFGLAGSLAKKLTQAQNQNNIPTIHVAICTDHNVNRLQGFSLKFWSSILLNGKKLKVIPKK